MMDPDRRELTRYAAAPAGRPVPQFYFDIYGALAVDGNQAN